MPPNPAMLSLALSSGPSRRTSSSHEKLRHIIFDKTLGLTVCREVGKGSYGRAWFDWIGLTIYTQGHIEDGLRLKEREVLGKASGEPVGVRPLREVMKPPQS